MKMIIFKFVYDALEIVSYQLSDINNNTAPMNIEYRIDSRFVAYTFDRYGGIKDEYAHVNDLCVKMAGVGLVSPFSLFQ